MKRIFERIHPRKWSILIIVMVSLVQATNAAPPPMPVQGTDFQAQRAFVGDPLRGLEVGDAGNLFEFNADDSTHMASTTKSFTLLLAVEAVENGYVSLNDIVTISTKAATISANHGGTGQNSHSEAGFSVGELVFFDDLLYSMILPSGGDASIAIAQHVAVSTDPSLADENDADQEAAFTAMMNDRADELELTDTEFFNSYGGDHVHADDNTAGNDTAHRATPRDMAIWFDYGMQYDLFREVAGFQGTYSFWTVFANNYSFNKSFGYPGEQAAKGGSGGGCGTCWILDARRVGRDIVAAGTQAQPGDGTTLLNYGYAALFHPTMVAESAEWTGGWVQNDLTAVNSNLAASAVVRPNGELRILLWGLDLNDGSITHLNPIEIVHDGPGGITTTSGGSDPRIPPDDRDPDPTEYDLAGVTWEPPPPGYPEDIAIYDPVRIDDVDLHSGEKQPVVEKARIIYADFGNLIVIADTDQGVYLYSYGITIDYNVKLRDWRFVGTGNEGRVHNFNAHLIVTAHRESNGKMMLKTWELDPESGKLTYPLDLMLGSWVAVDELELSGWTGPGTAGDFNVITTFLVGGNPIIRNFTVNFQDGAITYEDSFTSSLTGSGLALTRVNGFGRSIYALAFRNSSGNLVVQSYEIESDMQITLLRTTTDQNLLDADAEIKIAGFNKEGVMVAVQPDLTVPQQRLEVWAFDASANSNVITPNRIASETVFQDGLHALCRIPDNEAEGDFLLVPGTFALDGIRIQGWRSAPRH